jgi:hypothetical protein
MTIDFTAALPKAAAAQARGQGRKAAREGTKKKKAAKPPQKAPGEPGPIIGIKNINGDSSLGEGNLLLGSNRKDIRPLNLQEIKFLELYLSGKHTKKSAMIKAGFKHRSDYGLYFRANSIIKRYERGAADKADIFRDIGLGEVQIAKNIEKLASRSRSEMVKVQANSLAAKCLRLTDAPPPTHAGIQIVINTIVPGSAPDPGAPPPDRKQLINITPGEVDTDATPLQITR